MKLKDYAQYENLFFSYKSKYYYTHTGATQHSVGARNWSTGELEWLDGDLDITPCELPPRPMPPSESWIDCPDTGRQELRAGFKNYSRQVELYADAVTHYIIAEVEKGDWTQESPESLGWYWRSHLSERDVRELRESFAAGVAWADAGKPESPPFVLTEKGHKLLQRKGSS